MSHRKECLAAFVAIDLTFFICGRMARVPLALSRTKVGYHVSLSNFENDPPISCGSLSQCLRGASFVLFWVTVSLTDLRYLSHPFFIMLLAAYFCSTNVLNGF